MYQTIATEILKMLASNLKKETHRPKRDLVVSFKYMQGLLSTLSLSHLPGIVHFIDMFFLSRALGVRFEGHLILFMNRK